MLTLEKRPTSPARIAKIALGGIVGAALLSPSVSEIAARHQQSEFDGGRIYLSLAPGAAKHYHDPSAVVAKKERPDIRDGLTPPQMILRPETETPGSVPLAVSHSDTESPSPSTPR